MDNSSYQYDIEFISSMIDSMVPIIGLEMFICKTKDLEGNSIEETLQSYIVNEFYKRGKLDNKVDDQLLFKMKNEGYHGLTLLYHHFTGKGSNPELQDAFENQIEFIVSRKEILLHPSVKLFLETTKPSLIITTCPFDFIEKELNIADNTYDSVYYSINNEKNDPIPVIKEPRRKFGQDGQFVFHLFGATRVIDATSPWVCTERKLLLYLHTLHNQHTSDFKLANALEGKQFIVIGCNLPEWLFQFLLYPLKKANDANGSLWLSRTKAETNEEQEETISLLNEHLCTYNCTVHDYQILNDIANCYKNVNNNETVDDENTIYDFFVSHRSEDKEIARKVVDSLRQWGFNVWVDYEHAEHLGGAQWQNIQKIIERSRHIVPIITASYLNRFNDTDSNEEVGVGALTKIALEFMFPNYDSKAKKGANIPRQDAEQFILPVINCDEKIEVKTEYGMMDLDLNYKIVKVFWEKGLIPDIFRELHYFFISNKDEYVDNENHFDNVEVWREIQKQGHSMSEVGFLIRNNIK